MNANQPSKRPDLRLQHGAEAPNSYRERSCSDIPMPTQTDHFMDNRRQLDTFYPGIASNTVIYPRSNGVPHRKPWQSLAMVSTHRRQTMEKTRRTPRLEACFDMGSKCLQSQDG
jgi:hypothetical protein